VESSIAFPGLSINGFTNAPNAGIVFTSLKPFDERKGKDRAPKPSPARSTSAWAPSRTPS
jgi:hypothetical protein